MLFRGRSSSACWMVATVQLLAVFVASTLLLLLPRQQEIPSTHAPPLAAAHPLEQHQLLHRWEGEDVLLLETTVPQQQQQVAAFDDDDDGHSDDPFPPPLYGYQSLEEMKDRANRFPSTQERVQVYMSTWYLPPCRQSQNDDDDDDDDGFIHYRYLTPKNSNATVGDDVQPGLLLVEEIGKSSTVLLANSESNDSLRRHGASSGSSRRTFLLDSNATLGRLHFMVRAKMQPEQCDSEYCVDVLRHWYPAVDRVATAAVVNNNNNYYYGQTDDSLSSIFLFQFSDEELSRAYSTATDALEAYPNLPHLKKSRLALLPQDIGPHSSMASCSPVPKPTLPTVAQQDDENLVHAHLHPSTSVVCR